MTIIKRRIDQLEKEIEELENSGGEEQRQDNVSDSATKQHDDEGHTPDKEEGREEKDLSPEEKTYKGRYGNLRRFSQKQRDELISLKARIEELEQRPSQGEMPSTAEEIKEWAKTNPKAAAIIKSIAKEQALRESEALASKYERLEEGNAILAKEREEALVLKRHSDFFELRESEDFLDWVEAQPESMQNMVFDGDAKAVIYVIDLYKDLKKIKTKQNDKEAARATSKSSKPAIDDRAGQGRFSESIVHAMSMEEYEKYEDEILQSQRDGTFVYDLKDMAR